MDRAVQGRQRHWVGDCTLKKCSHSCLSFLLLLLRACVYEAHRDAALPTAGNLTCGVAGGVSTGG